MNLIDAIILGVVEGITEFLPISSTGHLIIVSNLLGLGDTPAEKHQIDAFNIMIQGGAILAVAGVFWPRVVQMLRGVLGRDAIGLRLVVNLFIAFLPAAVVGVLINQWVEQQLFYAGPVTAALFLGGVALLLLRKWQRKFFHEDADAEPHDAHSYVDIEHLTWRRALIVGLLQCVAMWPGTSRSMMTIIGGMLVGLKPKQAAEFSFLLGLPTLGGACIYKGFRNFVLEDTSVFDILGAAEVIVGFGVALVSAAIAVKWLISYLSRHGLALFGWYRIGLGLVLVGLLAAGYLSVEPSREVSPPDIPSGDVTGTIPSAPSDPNSSR